MMARVVAMQRCGIRRSTEGDQQAQSQKITHRVFSIELSCSHVMRGPLRPNLSGVHE
jgi:hypothetical protein